MAVIKDVRPLGAELERPYQVHDPTEARELVVDAWRMVVPKELARAYDLTPRPGLKPELSAVLGRAR